jgi:hypothetical protein
MISIVEKWGGREVKRKVGDEGEGRGWKQSVSMSKVVKNIYWKLSDNSRKKFKKEQKFQIFFLQFLINFFFKNWQIK